MKLQLTSITISIALGSAVFAGPAQAQSSNSYLYIAHAASGRSASSTGNPEFPVDIMINSTCVVKGESFGDIRGPFSGAAGTFNFVVTPANSVTPCSGTAILTSTVKVAAGDTYLGIIALDASNHVVGQIFPLDLAPIVAGHARVTVVNTTAQNLTATLAASPSGALAGQVNIPAGMALDVTPPIGVFTASIWLEGTTTLETGPVLVQIEARDMYLFVLAGSATDNTVQFIGPKVIRDVF